MALKKNRGGEISEEEISGNFRRIQIIAMMSFVFVIIAVLLAGRGKITVASIVSFVEGHRALCVLILVLLFAIKSLTIIVPLASLYLASGILFSPVRALLVSFLGVTAALTVPWLLGRWSGKDGIQYLRDKYPKIEKILSYQEENEAFACFITRIVGGLPCDVLSFYFGACKIDYFHYILASVGGCSLSLVMITLLGEAVLNPRSMEFIVLIILRLLFSVGVVLLIYLRKRKKKHD